jgi:hypothetical protein
MCPRNQVHSTGAGPEPRSGHAAIWLSSAAVADVLAGTGKSSETANTFEDDAPAVSTSAAKGRLLVWGGKGSAARYLVGRRQVYLSDGWVAELRQVGNNCPSCCTLLGCHLRTNLTVC